MRRAGNVSYNTQSLAHTFKKNKNTKKRRLERGDRGPGANTAPKARTFNEIPSKKGKKKMKRQLLLLGSAKAFKKSRSLQSRSIVCRVALNVSRLLEKPITRDSRRLTNRQMDAGRRIFFSRILNRLIVDSRRVFPALFGALNRSAVTKRQRSELDRKCPQAEECPE